MAAGSKAFNLRQEGSESIHFGVLGSGLLGT